MKREKWTKNKEANTIWINYQIPSASDFPVIIFQFMYTRALSSPSHSPVPIVCCCVIICYCNYVVATTQVNTVQVMSNENDIDRKQFSRESNQNKTTEEWEKNYGKIYGGGVSGT